MQITKEDYKKVIIRKPTDDEQRVAKIITSDYAISSITIHSSILKMLGLVDKVYRSKEAIIKYSNKKEIATVKKDLNAFVKFFPKSYTTEKSWIFNENCQKHPNFVQMVKDTQLKSWKGMIIPTFAKDFKTPSSFLKAEKYGRSWQGICDRDILDGMSEFFCCDMTIEQFKDMAFTYLDSIACDSVKGHTQTVIWETAYKRQLKIEEELGKNFTPKLMSFLLAPSTLDEIEREWEIRLEDYNGTWADLCDYLYSPPIISKIRSNLGVEVRSRTKGEVRKGSEFTDKKKFEATIAKYEQRLGCSVEHFNESIEKQKIENLKDELVKLEVQHEEARLAVIHARKNKSSDLDALRDAAKQMRNRINYLKTTIEKLEKDLPKKIEAYEIVKEYKKKNKDLMDFIESSRSWEEVSQLEEDSLADALKRQKNEQSIPYYTWRFVCDKIDRKTAQLIEETLEENLNKGSGVNGEDGYVNVTSFPMEKSFEFFVDYPKSSNMFRAFKNKGKKLGSILMEGVAHHLGIKFVCCEGETFVNSPMEKTMGGDMLEWVGI